MVILKVISVTLSSDAKEITITPTVSEWGTSESDTPLTPSN